jgi:hypothetical protein
MLHAPIDKNKTKDNLSKTQSESESLGRDRSSGWAGYSSLSLGGEHRSVQAKQGNDRSQGWQPVSLSSVINQEQEFPEVPPIVHEVLNSPGQPLDPSARVFMESQFGHDFSRVQVYEGGRAAESASALNANAYTVGQQIIFGEGQYQPDTFQGRLLLAHELIHSVQQAQALREAPIQIKNSPVLEGNADQVVESVMLGNSLANITNVPVQAAMPSVPEKIVLRGITWLSKRTTKLVSKHIAKHARRIAGKAIHSVFKSPKDIKLLLKTTLREAGELAARNSKAPVTQILEEGGVKIARQGTRTPGKFRLIVQKTFGKEIGTNGEKILRIIIDQSGRIVTAFPADRLLAIGFTVGTIELFGERTASANEVVREQAKAKAEREEKAEEGLDWQEFIPFIGMIWGGSLNEGEDEMIRDDRFIQNMIEDIIKEIEFSEQRSFDGDRRREIEDLVRAAIAAPMIGEESEE